MERQYQIITGKENYIIKDNIDQGLSKNIYLVEGESSKKFYSMRVFREQQHQEQSQSKVYQEKELTFVNDCINNRIKEHENILNFVDYIHNKDSNQHFLIQEYCEAGSLFEFILKSKMIPQTQQIQICLQISKGLEWLHSQNIIHRDLKPESILLTKRDERFIFKITDFGYSCFAQNQLQSIIGTINYMAPEILSQKPYDKTVDIWALGLIMYEVAYRKQLFQQKTVQQTAQMILSFQSLDEQQHSQNELFQVIRQCLIPDINTRLTIDKIVELLQKIYDEKILQEKQQNEQYSENREVDSFQQFDREFSNIYNEMNGYDNSKQEQKIVKRLTISQFNQFISKLGSIKYAAPQQKGFFQKLKGSVLTPFKMNEYAFQLVCNDLQKFYCNLFHFVLCGKLLGCLQEFYNVAENLFQDNLADSFQEWVMKLIQESSEIDQSIKKDQFQTLYYALSQIANIRDIYFRINTYLGWIEDSQYLQQSTKLAQIMYERMQQQDSKLFLPDTQVQIIKQDIVSGIILSTQGGLYDCFVFEENNQQTIIMQVAYLSAIQSIELQSKQKEKQIQELILQFKKYIINEGFFKQAQQIVEKFKNKTLQIYDNLKSISNQNKTQEIQ
ncbi:hypothetical protein ABPG74_018011 [Tetrahymena malaccensis]